MADATQLNGQLPIFSDIEFNIQGVDFIDVKAIDYNYTQEVTAIHTVGKDPRFFTKDKRVYNATITLTTYGLSILRKAARDLGLKFITQLPRFSIIIKYQFEGGQPKIDILKEVMIKGDGMSASEGSADALTYQLPLFVGQMELDSPI